LGAPAENTGRANGAVLDHFLQEVDVKKKLIGAAFVL
jgi:hypothetical protein